jgi:hypothetical protein
MGSTSLSNLIQAGTPLYCGKDGFYCKATGKLVRYVDWAFKESQKTNKRTIITTANVKTNYP